MTSIPFIPSNWYWIVANSALQVYSSARNSLVSSTMDATYQTWLGAGNTPTRIDTFASLCTVLIGALAPTYQQLLAFGTNVASAATVADLQFVQQAALDTLLDANYSLPKFTRQGQATGITGANVGAFLAQITNNYRTLRASIAAATTLAQLNAIDITLGWPANP